MRKSKFSVYSILKNIILLLVVIVTLYPFIYMVSVSISDSIYVLKGEVTLLPRGFNLGVYQMVLSDKHIFSAYMNTVLYTVSGTVIALCVTCAGAYAVSKKRMVGSRFFSMMILFTMFFGGGLIPTYLTVKALGMYNSIWAIILPGAVSTWNFLIMRSFFKQFPSEIEESGKIDGMTDLGVFFRLVLPLSTAVLATIALFYAVGIWNSYFGPMIYLSDNNKYPLQVILRDIVIIGQSNVGHAGGSSGDSVAVDESIKYATIIVSIVPIVLIYPFIQRYFVKGVMIGSLKG
jgi:putative aldouronate transport system permease protein